MPRIVLAALLCTASIAGGQGWQGGIKTGISHAGLIDSDEFAWNSAPSTAAFAWFPVGGPFSVQPELAHLRRTGISTIAGSNLRLKADYVELPILLQLRLGSLMGVAPFVGVGPTVAFRLRCRLQFVGGGVRTDDDCDGARGVQSNRLDVGVAAGAGLGWSLRAVTLVIEGRATAGVRPYVLPTDVQDARSSAWSVLAGVSWPLYRASSMPPVRVPVFAASPIPPVMPARFPTTVPEVSQSPSALLPQAVVELPSRRRLTVEADNVDVREVLMGIAQAAGMEVIVSPGIRKRVTAALFDVDADDAIQSIALTAGLRVIRPGVPGRAILVVPDASPPPTKR